MYVKIENTGDLPYDVKGYSIKITIGDKLVCGFNKAIANVTFIPGELMDSPKTVNGELYTFKNETSGTIAPNESKVFFCYADWSSRFNEGGTFSIIVVLDDKYTFSTTIVIP